MRIDFRNCLIDLKAATALEREESIDVALNGLRTIPEIASNQRLGTSFIKKNLLSFGKLIGSSTVPLSFLENLLNDQLAAMRAIAAIALGMRFRGGSCHKVEVLARAGRDNRQEVRKALELGLLEGKNGQANLAKLCEIWLKHNSPKLQQIALAVLPHLHPSDALILAKQLLKKTNDMDKPTREAFAIALTSIANHQPQAILEILEKHINSKETNPWLVKRVLSSPWAERYPNESQALLALLEG